MNRVAAGLVLIVLASPAWAKKHLPTRTCRTQFTVVQEDYLKNITQGLSKKQVKWFEKKIEKKYPDVCYVAPARDVPLVFFIVDTPAVYHGSRVETHEETHDTPVTGTVTDEDGNESDIHGSMTTATTTSTAVPYTAHYGIYTLTVETREGPGKWKARRRFQQGGLYHLVYGVPMGKGHHPTRTVIEEAVKWVHQGGLTNPLETVAPH
jgi:hypothetical protein